MTEKKRNQRLKELSKKDEKWRMLAVKITAGNRSLADELVNEMYLRRYDNDRGQEMTDYYIVCTMRSIYLNMKKKNDPIPVAEIFDNQLQDEKFEPNDEELKYISRAKNLPYHKRELLELNYDYSLREIQDEFKINYGYVHRTIKDARKEVLNGDFSKYKNKRLKHKKMSKERMEGLGDLVEKMTIVTGIKQLVKAVAGEDCGCDERKEKLNEFWRFKLKPKCLTTEDIEEYEKFVKSRRITLLGKGKAKGSLSPQEITFICDFYGMVFNQKPQYPTCSHCSGTAARIIGMIYKLDLVFVNNLPKQPEKASGGDTGTKDSNEPDTGDKTKEVKNEPKKNVRKKIIKRKPQRKKPTPRKTGPSRTVGTKTSTGLVKTSIPIVRKK